MLINMMQVKLKQYKNIFLNMLNMFYILLGLIFKYTYRSEPRIVNRHSCRGLYLKFSIFYQFSCWNTNCVYIETKTKNSERRKFEVRRTASQVCFLSDFIITHIGKHFLQSTYNKLLSKTSMFVQHIL